MNKSFWLSLIILVTVLTSCGSPNRITYFRDMEAYRDYPVMQRNEIKIQEGDRLSIVVDAKNPELAAPFNTNHGTIRITNDGDITPTTVREVEKGYIVDANGDIEFPVLGKLHVMGLTHLQLVDLIKKRLIAGSFIKEPIVNVELLNLKILLIGETGNQVVSVPDNKVTILEALTRAGGVNNNGKMSEVTVVREENGVRQMYLVDLNSVKLFDSPVYYLQQNDIVYVKPTAAPLPPRFNQVWTNIGMVSGVFSLIVSLLILSKQ